uniref:STAR protein homodimerisation region domain-containing protein n=1 Tax=Paramormyrops kingsleyae TaxID=1676925 RepID=A0A3B3SXX2_9TELE
MMVGEIEVKERPRPSPDYLMQLLNEKKLMASLPNLCGIFTHLERLLDEERAECGGRAGNGACVWLPAVLFPVSVTGPL